MVGARLVWGKCVCLTWSRRSEEQASDLKRIQGAAEGSPGKRAVLSSCFLQPSGTVFLFLFCFYFKCILSQGAPSLSTLCLSLTPAGGHHISALHLPHLKTLVSLRGQRLPTRAALAFVAAAQGCPLDTWLCAPGSHREAILGRLPTPRAQTTE